MATKKINKKTGGEINPKTGCKIGSLGDKVGKAYLSKTTYEGSIGEVEKVLTGVAKSKGKSESKDYAHVRAISWLGFLQNKYPGLYPERARVFTRAKVSSPNGHQTDGKKVHAATQGAAKVSDKVGSSA